MDVRKGGGLREEGRRNGEKVILYLKQRHVLWKIAWYYPC
jgi:hypothetical protein